MREFSSIVSDLTPGQWENVKAEFRISPFGFGDRVKLIAPNISDEDVAVLLAELTAEHS